MRILVNTVSRWAEVITENSLSRWGEVALTSCTIFLRKSPTSVSVSWSAYGEIKSRRKTLVGTRSRPWNWERATRKEETVWRSAFCSISST